MKTNQHPVSTHPFESRVYNYHYGQHKTKQAAINAMKREAAKAKRAGGGTAPAHSVADRRTGETVA